MNDFKDLFAEDKLQRDKVARIINIYDNMKYSLEDVPSTLTHFDLRKLLEVESGFDIKRLLKKLCRKEAEFVLRKELQKHSKPPEETKSSSSNESRAGLFNPNGQLCYGLSFKGNIRWYILITLWYLPDRLVAQHLIHSNT